MKKFFKDHKLFKLFGIDVNLNASFIWGFVLLTWLNSNTWYDAGAYMSFILLMFICVLAHEYGHMLTARHLGYKIDKVSLHVLGGAAIIEGLDGRNARDEFLVTIAGPMVNVLITVLMWNFVNIPDTEAPFSDQIIEYVFVSNIVMAAFNMIPMYPMDGGRIMRSSLLMATGNFIKSSKTAIYISFFFGALLLAYSLFRFQPILALICFAMAAYSFEELKMLKKKEKTKSFTINISGDKEKAKQYVKDLIMERTSGIQQFTYLRELEENTDEVIERVRLKKQQELKENPF